MADLCLSCGEYVGQNAEDSPYCKCDRKKLKELKEIAEKYKLMMTPTAKDMEKALQIVQRLKKLSPEIISIAEALDDYHSGKRIKDLVQKILGEEK